MPRSTSKSATVSVRVAQNDSGASLSVRNFGISLESEESQRVFDRFWRADPSCPRAGRHRPRAADRPRGRIPARRHPAGLGDSPGRAPSSSSRSPSTSARAPCPPLSRAGPAIARTAVRSLVVAAASMVAVAGCAAIPTSGPVTEAVPASARARCGTRQHHPRRARRPATSCAGTSTRCWPTRRRPGRLRLSLCRPQPTPGSARAA